jgi:RNA polymerase sigma factor (sigma-70 family)
MAEGDDARRELPVSGDRFDRRAGSLFDAAMADDDLDDDRRALRDEMLSLLATLVATGLTERQRQIVELYFTDGCTQAEIGERLGISQQVVSRQLFGVVREGKRIGGAIRRLRVLCEEHGIDPERWV